MTLAQRYFLPFLLTACCLSCESKEAREQRLDLEKIHHHTDSLAATGEHGYYVATYLIGRFKTSRFQAEPFDVEIGHMDERLLESPILVQIDDTAGYQLTYAMDGEEKKVKGRFNDVLLGNDLSIRLAGDENVQKRRYFDVELRVYMY